MAIEIRITRELNDFAPKAIGPFTVRQFVCVVCAVVPAYMMVVLLEPYLSMDVRLFLVMIPAGLAWAFGWPKPYGMHMEVFIRSIFISMFLAPASRKYRGKNRIRRLIDKLDAADTEEQEASAKGQKKKTKTPKYKRSPLAYK